VSQNVQNDREAVQTMLQSYLFLFSQQRWDEWIDLWADDGVLEFPFAPAGLADRTTDAVRTLTGRPPSSFRAFAQAHADVWRQVR
jgi:ketosteroid isomerase-like protein